MHEYYFSREGSNIITRVRAPTLADAMLKLAYDWYALYTSSDKGPRTFTTAEAQEFLESIGVSLVRVEDLN